jgi:hypothetical protein
MEGGYSILGGCRGFKVEPVNPDLNITFFLVLKNTTTSMDQDTITLLNSFQDEYSGPQHDERAPLEFLETSGAPSEHFFSIQHIGFKESVSGQEVCWERFKRRNAKAEEKHQGDE